MLAVVLMGVAATVVGKQWTVQMKRDREAELIFRGERIKNAIQAFAADDEVMKATRPNRYPVSLQQLTQKPKRYLQQVYKDPITGQDFELIKVGAEIRGVKSRSKEAPLDQVRFKNAATYSQVLFQVEQQAQACVPGPNPLNPLAPPIVCPPGGSPAAPPASPTAAPGAQAPPPSPGSAAPPGTSM